MDYRVIFLFLDTKVAVTYDSAPNTYQVQVNDGNVKIVEAYVKLNEQGLRLITKIGEKTSNVGLLTFDHEVHVYDEVTIFLFNNLIIICICNFTYKSSLDNS